MIDRETYRAEKARLKRVRKALGDELYELRHGPRAWADEVGTKEYGDAVIAYCEAQDDLRDWIHTHGEPSIFGTATRAERRKAWLRRRGIKPVWDEEN